MIDSKNKEEEKSSLAHGGNKQTQEKKKGCGGTDTLVFAPYPRKRTPLYSISITEQGSKGELERICEMSVRLSS